MKQPTKILLSLGLMTLGVLQSPLTRADVWYPPVWGANAMFDQKTTPGSVCQPAIGANSPAWNYTTNLWAGGSGITNVSAAPQSTVCPLLRDDTEALNPYAVRVFVNNVAAANLTCILQSRFANAALVAANTQGTAAAGNQILTFVMPPATKVAGGHYNLLCQVPAGASINSIELTEAWIDNAIRTDRRN